MTTEYLVLPFGMPDYWSSITFTPFYAQVVTSKSVDVLDLETANQLLAHVQNRPDQYLVEVVS